MIRLYLSCLGGSLLAPRSHCPPAQLPSLARLHPAASPCPAPRASALRLKALPLLLVLGDRVSLWLGMIQPRQLARYGPHAPGRGASFSPGLAARPVGQEEVAFSLVELVCVTM